MPGTRCTCPGLLRLGQITPVRVPTEIEESDHDLVRAREPARSDLRRVRHRASKLLLRHGIVYSGAKAWTCAREACLLKQHVDYDAPSRRSPDCWVTGVSTAG